MIGFNELKALGVTHNRGYVCNLAKAGKFPAGVKANEKVLWDAAEISAWVVRHNLGPRRRGPARIG